MLMMVPKRCPFLTSILKHKCYMCASLCPENTSYIKEQSMQHDFQSLPRWGHSSKRVCSDSTRNRVISVRVSLVRVKPTTVTLSEYTPSFMMFIRRVFSLLRSLFQVSSLCEIIFNANPCVWLGHSNKWVFGSFQHHSKKWMLIKVGQNSAGVTNA